ncbi:MAG: RNA 3'-phosphate cyclase [Promethearchaeota archaeon]|nr:MAG: RNA 3'-phosphate cyclase [Candidatus Lokiarchaeota archaeon]
MSKRSFLRIDGSFGEGGGSILRLSAGFSLLFDTPIEINNIRANRPKPGLRLQHLLGLRTLSNLTNSELSKCDVGTTNLSFIPNREIKPKIETKIGTAASIGLLLQPIQIACLGFENSDKIEIYLVGGGTFGKWAPSLNYLKEVSYQIFKRSGLMIDIEIQKHGFYPKGDARVKCVIHPPQNQLNPINLIELGNIDHVNGEIIITKQLRKDIPERIRDSIKQHSNEMLGMEARIKISWVDSSSPGVGLSLWSHSDTGAIISTGTILGEKGIPSEKLGLMAVKELNKYVQNRIPVDNYLSDQLIPLMAYVKSPSRIKVLEITSHAKTNLDLIKLFTKRKYKIKREQNGFLIEYE